MKITRKQLRKLISEAMINPEAFIGKKGIPASIIPADDYEDAKTLSGLSVSGDEGFEHASHLIDDLYGGPPATVRMSGGYKGLQTKTERSKYDYAINAFNGILESNGMTVKKGKKDNREASFEARKENNKGDVLRFKYTIVISDDSKMFDLGSLLYEVSVFKKINDETVKICSFEDTDTQNIFSSDLESIVEYAEEVFREVTKLLDPAFIYKDIKNRTKVIQDVISFMEINRERIEFDNLTSDDILNEIVNPVQINEEVLENMLDIRQSFARSYEVYVSFLNKSGSTETIVNYLTDIVMNLLLNEIENLMYDQGLL